MPPLNAASLVAKLHDESTCTASTRTSCCCAGTSYYRYLSTARAVRRQYLIANIANSDEEYEDGVPVFSGLAGAGGPEVVAVCRGRPAGCRQGRRKFGQLDR